MVKRGQSQRDRQRERDRERDRDRTSNSRHSTPLSNIGDKTPATAQTATSPNATAPVTQSLSTETAYSLTPTSALVSSDPSIETLINNANASNKLGDPPSAKDLHTLHDKISEGTSQIMGRRGDACDRSMRQLAQRRKDLYREAEERARIEELERKKEKTKKLSKKRIHDDVEIDANEEENLRREKMEALPSVGAHGIARQDGIGVHEGQQAPPSPVVAPGTAVIELTAAPQSPSDSEASRVPAPAQKLYERVFGQDPTRFADATVYDIRPLREGMTDEEEREALCVAHWPESDLSHLTAGDPPDQDFSNAKPPNQVNFTTFQTYVEPYIRPFTEEDVAFLKERGDRTTPYVMPQRGPKSYKEVWALEDGMEGIAPPKKFEPDYNEARGTIDDINDETAGTDAVNMGPVTNRMLSVLRPMPSSAKKEANEDAEGDVIMSNAEGQDYQQQEQVQAGASAAEEAPNRPATCLPPDAPRPTTLTVATEYDSIEQRTVQELRQIGFLGPSDASDFADHNDDEVAARIRTLQAELHQVSRTNNARKARVLELVEERMAMQEYANIADDLDNQVNAAYLKRNRSLSKPAGSKKGTAARQGLKGVAATSVRGVSEGVRALMQKRKDWIDHIGPVVSFGRPPILGDNETIFDEASMRPFERAEREAEAGEGDTD